MKSDRDIAVQLATIRDKLIAEGVDLDEDSLRALYVNLWDMYTTDGNVKEKG